MPCLPRMRCASRLGSRVVLSFSRASAMFVGWAPTAIQRIRYDFSRDLRIVEGRRVRLESAMLIMDTGFCHLVLFPPEPHAVSSTE
jgi:hypothetical protein